MELYKEVIKSYELLMEANTKVMKNFHAETVLLNRLIKCLETEIVDFKRSNIYKQYQSERNG